MRRECTRCRRPLPDEIQARADWQQLGPDIGPVVCAGCLTLQEEQRIERRQGLDRLGSTLWDDAMEDLLADS